MKTNFFKSVIAIFVFLAVGSYVVSHTSKAFADGGAPCMYSGDQKTADGNGPNTADQQGVAPAYHCNSSITITSETQSGNTITINGQIWGGGITAYCEFAGSTDQLAFPSEEDRLSGDTNSLRAYDGNGNLVNSTVNILVQGQAGQDCSSGPLDQQSLGNGQALEATFTYSFNVSSGYQSGQQYTTYVSMTPDVEGLYQTQYDTNNYATYRDNYNQYTYQQCIAMGWTSSEDCRDYWTYYRFTPTVASGSGTLNVSADRPASWNIQGCPSNNTCSGTNLRSGSYSNEPAGVPYSITDLSGNSLAQSGFSADNIGTVLRNPASIFARIIKTAEASSCLPNGFTCDLSPGGQIVWNLHSQYCALTIKTQVNGNDTALSGLNYTVSGGPGNSPQTLTSTPQTYPQMIADPTSGSTFSLAINSDPSSSNGYSLDRANSVTGLSVPCQGGNTGVIIVNYSTRASLNVK